MATLGVQSRSHTAGLPFINAESIYRDQIRDRNPQIRAAGKLTATGDSAQLCMKPPGERPNSPEVVRKFRATLRPDAGKKRVFYGKAYDPHLKWANDMTHGVMTQPSYVARELLNPDPNTRFQQKLVDKKESLYASHQRAPLGISHNQASGLPEGLNPTHFTFGIKTIKDGSAGELVSPDKPRQQVNAEHEQGRDLYRQTHWNYRVGEQKVRNYTYPSFKRMSNFGIPTPHDNAGSHVKKSMHWLHDELAAKRAPVLSKRVDDFRERTQPQLGTVHDPIKDTLNVAPDHTFGILLKPDEYGAGDLIHGRGPSQYLRGKDRIRGLVSAMRQHLKKANYHNFQDLTSAFRHYDKNKSGKIDINELREACIQFNLPVEPELLEQLMDYCDADQDGLINYMEFANFLNWKDKMPTGQGPPRLAQSAPADLGDPRANKIQKQIDQAIGHHRTSSSMVNAIIGGVDTRGYRKYGCPTVRTDLPAPRIRRIDDRKNYGDESDCYGLLNPSMFSSHGVYEKDFLLPRPREEIRHIFNDIGVRMDWESFDQIYKVAAARHPLGQVSVESFRNVLDEAQSVSLQQGIVY